MEEKKIKKENKKVDIKLSARTKRYLLWPAISQLLLFVFTGLMIYYEPPTGIIFAGVSLIHLMGFVFVTMKIREILLNEVFKKSTEISLIQKNHLMYMKFPHINMDLSGKVLWANKAFQEIMQGEKIIDNNISNLIGNFKIEDLPMDQEKYVKDIVIGKNNYRMEVRRHAMEAADNGLLSNMSDYYYYSLILNDTTELVRIRQENINQQTIIGYIYVDNYDEALNSIDEARKPILTALIERNLQRFAKAIEGVIVKTDKDRFMTVFKRDKLKVLDKNKFEVLDDIRDISIGNDQAVTISIGIGIHPSNLAEASDNARIALDLALGRGGDQAVIKNNDDTLFYGGKTKGVEVNTRVKSRIKAHALREIILDSDSIIIMGHKNQDLDSLGAALGVYVCVREYKKDAHIVINNITSSVRGLYDSIVNDSGYPKDLLVDSNKAISLLEENTTVIVVDVNRPSITETPELLERASKIVVLDHHRASTEQIINPVLRYVEPTASSACEMVTEILQYISDKIRLSPLEANALLSGIVVDTKNFVVNTGVKTFEAAAFLKKKGADILKVREFYKSDMNSYKAKASAVKDAIVYRNELVISVTPGDIENPTLVAAQAADDMLNIKGIKASFVFTQTNSVIYISARSLNEVNVQLIMEKLGGGGHLNVAGAQVKDMTIEEAINLLKEKIDEYYLEEKKQ